MDLVRRRYRMSSRKFLCFSIQLILLISPIKSIEEDYKNKYDNYDYYGDYDSMDDDGNYAELGPAAYDYIARSESNERLRKAAKNIADAAVDHSCEDATDGEQEAAAVATTCAPTGGGRGNARTTTCAPESMTTTCRPVSDANDCAASAYIDKAFQAPGMNTDQPQKAKELRDLVQHLYISQARVQLEASEIKKAQAIANEAQQQLEEAANHVRAVTAALQNAQQEVATSAIRAQTAQLQLAAHDQLLFAARQDVDALSSRMVGLQAAEGISQPQVNFDIGALMQKLRQPLMDNDRPTPVPSIALPNSKVSTAQRPTDFYYDDDYEEY